VKVGDLVRVEWKEADFRSTAVIVGVPSGHAINACGNGFYMILCEGQHRVMHSDFMRVISNNKPLSLEKLNENR